LQARPSSIVKSELARADIIFPLLSADFLASDYVFSVEMSFALRKADAREAQLIPVILRPVDWTETPFGRFQVLPRDATPITRYSDRDAGLADVAAGLRIACLGAARPATTLPAAQPVKSYLPLSDVFVPNGVPTLTFVQPENFYLLKWALSARLRSHRAGSRLRLGWARRWSIRRIAARVTIASETSGSAS
jgi:hypothetical protein